MTWFVLLGAGSGLCWGIADFFGGLQSRRLPALAVAFWSQVAGALALSVVLLVWGGPPLLLSVEWGALAGIFGALGVACFYRALAIGVMSLVAPVAACGALVPVVVALVGGEQLGLAPSVGIVATLAGIVIVSLRQETGRESARSDAAPPRDALLLAFGAALSFGGFFVFLSHGSALGTQAPLWTVAGARLASLPTLLVLIAAGPRTVPWPGRRIVPVAAIGVLDTVANALFTYASTHGSLGIAAVLGSLYPVATVLLGRFVLHERLTRLQSAGVVLALAGVALLAWR